MAVRPRFAPFTNPGSSTGATVVPSDQSEPFVSRQRLIGDRAAALNVRYTTPVGIWVESGSGGSHD